MFLKFALHLSAFLVKGDAGNYAQLSSTDNQPNGPLGDGVPITYESIDALGGSLKFEKGGSKITITRAGTLFRACCSLGWFRGY